MSEMIKITGLWKGKNKDKNGNIYLSGTMGNATVLIFVNTFKEEGSKQPDYNMFIAPKKEREGGNRTRQQQAEYHPEDDL